MRLDSTDISAYAVGAGLDVARCHTDLEAHMDIERVHSDIEIGVHSGVHGIPILVGN
jgi:predicted DsbA family dithiol-disulfide isomerase